MLHNKNKKTIRPRSLPQLMTNGKSISAPLSGQAGTQTGMQTKQQTHTDMPNLSAVVLQLRDSVALKIEVLQKPE